MAFWRRPQAEATSGETLTKKKPLARSTRTIYRSSWLWSFHRTIVKTIRSNVFNCDMKHRWTKCEIMIRNCMGEKVLICFSKDAVVTHSARKLKNSILGSTLYWFHTKRQHWNTGIHGDTYHNDTFLRNNKNGKTEQRKLNNFITLLGCVMLVAFLYPRL